MKVYVYILHIPNTYHYISNIQKDTYINSMIKYEYNRVIILGLRKREEIYDKRLTKK